MQSNLDFFSVAWVGFSKIVWVPSKFLNEKLKNGQIEPNNRTGPTMIWENQAYTFLMELYDIAMKLSLSFFVFKMS